MIELQLMGMIILLASVAIFIVKKIPNQHLKHH